MINTAVPAEKLEETVREVSRKIMANSLETVAAYKHLYNHGSKDTLEKGLMFEAESEFDINDTEERIKEFRKKD